MVNEIETNVCKKKKEKKGSVSSRVVVRIYVNAIIFSTIANEHWENIGSIILSIDLSIPCFLFFFFFTNAYVKIQRMISLRCSCNPLRIYRFHTHRWTRCILRFFPSLHFFFSFLVASRVFSLLVSLQLRYFVAIYEYIIWSKGGIRIKYTRVE